ncbi:serine carboxypeptidase [Panaeolus papilionaceus]|nr:serine carboxypeptidase [Panaeolus papilionaceus]
MRSWLSLLLVQIVSAAVSRGAPPVLDDSNSQVVINPPYSPNADGDVTTRFRHGDHGYTQQDNIIYEFVTHPDFKDYQLRITEPDLCDPSVKQYSGYLDTATDKHFFFWFFESRNDPAEDPLILWLSGGPGCSSSFGLLFELGPCKVVDKGTNVVYNPHGWNKNANIIFLDQPIDTGFSYGDQGKTVYTSAEAAQDVYKFLQLFLNRYSKYSKTPFHIAAESYGGVIGPNIASIIYHANQKLQSNPKAHAKHINLASIALGNALTDPLVQMASTADYVCNTDGPYPILNPESSECKSLRRTKIPICERLTKACYAFKSRLTCAPAEFYCYTQVWGVIAKTGRNQHDARLKCDRVEDKYGPECYEQAAWVDTWMNIDAHKVALGVDPDRNFVSCNLNVMGHFFMMGDGMYPTYQLLPELVDAGIRLLVYAGNAGNAILWPNLGKERWVNKLDSKFKDEFQSTKPKPWVLQDGTVAGEMRSAGGQGLTAGNVTFVQIYEAGHMVPYDQPEAASELITRWIANLPLV